MRLAATVNLLLGGDVFLGGDDFMRGRTQKVPWPSIEMLLPKADLFFVNLEGPVINAPSRRKKGKINLANPPWSFECLRRAGVDVVSLANNHSMDFGDEGVASTLAHVGDFPAAGLGVDEDEAARPVFLKAKNLTIGFLAFAEDIPGARLYAQKDSPGYNRLEREHVLSTAREALGQCDCLVVYMHHGLMRLHHPTPWIRSLCRELADIGVSLIVGSHCHHYQGWEWVGQTLICYGLGDLFFGEVSGQGLYDKPFSINKTSLILDAAIGGDGKVKDFRLHPFRQVSNLETRALTGRKKNSVMTQLSHLSRWTHDGRYGEFFAVHNSRDPRALAAKTARFIREFPPMAERVWWACQSKYPANMVVSPGYRKSLTVERILSMVENARGKKVGET